jgi:cell division transport system permease protein
MPREKVTKRPKLAREGILGRFTYFVERAIINIRQNCFLNIVTIATIALAFLLLSLFLLVFVNLERVADSWSERVQVSVYFDRELSSTEITASTKMILAIPGVTRVHYVSKDEAFKRFSSRLRGQENFLDGVAAEILPSSFELALDKGNRDSDSLTLIAARLKQIQGFNEIQYGEEWVQRFTDFMFLVKFAGLLLAGFIVTAVVFIVANTIKLTIYSRKDELEIMGLVGATRMFIKGPFLIEGVIQGVLGSTLAVGILSGVYFAFLRKADVFFSFSTVKTGMLFLPIEYILYLLLAGALLGFLGSLASLKRFVTL